VGLGQPKVDYWAYYLEFQAMAAIRKTKGANEEERKTENKNKKAKSLQYQTKRQTYGPRIHGLKLLKQLWEGPFQTSNLAGTGKKKGQAETNATRNY